MHNVKYKHVIAKMKKMKKLLKERFQKLAGIKPLYEQQQNEPGTTYQLRTCSNPGHAISQCIPDSFFGGSPVAAGHSLTIGYPPQPGNQGGVKDVYVQTVDGSCVWYESSGNTYPINLPTPAQINPGPLNSCPNAPAAPLSCPGCNGGQYTWNNMQNWMNSFNNLGPFNSSNPNQPCNFLNNKIAQWTNTQQGLGGCSAFYNQLECKIKHATILHQQNNC